MVALITYIAALIVQYSYINVQSGFDRISYSYPRVFLRRLNHVVWRTSPQWPADRAIAKYMAFSSPYRCLLIIIVFPSNFWSLELLWASRLVVSFVLAHMRVRVVAIAIYGKLLVCGPVPSYNTLGL